MHFLQARNGDCTLIIDHVSARAILMDCHPSARDRAKELLRDAGVDLTLAIVSHFHADHYGGVGDVVNSFGSVGVRYNPPSTNQAPEEMRRLRAVLRTLRKRVSHPNSGMLMAGSTGYEGPVRWRCYAPDLNLLTAASEKPDPNKASTVVKFELDGLSFVVPGDADAEVWESVLAAGGLGEVDVLRVPHHGGAMEPGSDVDEVGLISALDPTHLVVSAGTGNVYGHPTTAWLRPHEHGCRVLCTQVTSRCHPPLSTSNSPRSCAGEITIIWRPVEGWRIFPSDTEHAQRIDEWDQPQCRPSTHQAAEQPLGSGVGVGADVSEPQQ